MADVADLVGRWHLVSMESIDDRGVVTHPFGESPQGLLIHLPEGWAAVQVEASSRPAPSTADALAGSESERAAAFSTYVASAGRYAVEVDTVVHVIELSLFPQLAGTGQVRVIVFRDGDLVLGTPPVPFGGRIVTNELRWCREK